MNRYISSTAKNESLKLFDLNTGYLKNVSDVIRLACQHQVCASGVVGLGVALSSLKFPGHENSAAQLQRFLDGNDRSNNFSGMADIYDEGAHWNTHVYCLPQNTQLNSAINCSQ